MTYPTTPPQALPLSQPLPRASFGQAISRFFRKYATFSGRASRSEFWWVTLFLGLIAAGFAIVGFIFMAATGRFSETATGAEAVFSGTFLGVLYILYGLWAIAVFIPWLALGVRRLHDVNMSGWWMLLYFIGVGAVFIYIIALIPSNPAGARFDAPGSR